MNPKPYTLHPKPVLSESPEPGVRKKTCKFNVDGAAAQMSCQATVFALPLFALPFFGFGEWGITWTRIWKTGPGAIWGLCEDLSY